MLNTEVKLNNVMDYLKDTLFFIIGLIFTILGWQYRRINDIDKKVNNLRKEFDEKYITKDVFEEFKDGLYTRLDDIIESIRELKKDIKNTK